ncbi:biotin--[acetyl-CoA-carboxylase] ligase, partial [bacterium]|nr:biotin--[acetyl-CoA-carboxylase] ligase [bacterium]
VKGIFEDVNPDGSLRLRLANNVIQNIISGDFQF